MSFLTTIGVTLGLYLWIIRPIIWVIQEQIEETGKREEETPKKMQSFKLYR